MASYWRKMTWDDRHFRDWKCDDRHGDWCNEMATWVCEQDREDGGPSVTVGYACDKHVPRIAIKFDENDLLHGLSASLPHLDAYLMTLRTLASSGSRQAILPSGGTVDLTIRNVEEQIGFVRRLLGVQTDKG